MRKIILFLVTVLFIFSFTACGSNEGNTGNNTGNNNGGDKVSELSGDALSAGVKWNGRTELKDGAVYFYHTAAGFEVSFFGTKLTAELTTDNTTIQSRYANLAVAVDGEEITSARVVVLDKESETVTLAQSLSEGIHTVRVIKRSEPQDSANSLKQLNTDGYFTAPPASSDMKILCVGASGISGHGSVGTKGQARTTANSSSLHSFGYLTARMFGADVQFVSNSGWGLKFGYNQSGKTLGIENLAKAVNYIGIDKNNKIIEREYDSASFVPDFIIVNAGGNDYNSYVNTLSGAAQTAARQEFSQAVVDFCTDMLTKYPDAIILWTHTKGSQNGSAAATAINGLQSSLRNSIAVVVIKQVGEDGDPEGADAHAGLKTHIKNADILAEIISSVSGRTDKIPNITAV